MFRPNKHVRALRCLVWLLNQMLWYCFSAVCVLADLWCCCGCCVWLSLACVYAVQFGVFVFRVYGGSGFCGESGPVWLWAMFQSRMGWVLLVCLWVLFCCVWRDGWVFLLAGFTEKTCEPESGRRFVLECLPLVLGRVAGCFVVCSVGWRLAMCGCCLVVDALVWLVRVLE